MPARLALSGMAPFASALTERHCGFRALRGAVSINTACATERDGDLGRTPKNVLFWSIVPAGGTAQNSTGLGRVSC
jgi:hypothetical protein